MKAANTDIMMFGVVALSDIGARNTTRKLVKLEYATITKAGEGVTRQLNRCYHCERCEASDVTMAQTCGYFCEDCRCDLCKKEVQ